MAIKPVSGKIESQELNDNFSYLETKIENTDGGPFGLYSTTAELNSVYPNGRKGFAVIDGYSYWWKNGAWTQGGLYQSRGIAPHSVSYEHTNFITGGNLFNGQFSSQFVDSNTGEIKTDNSGVVKSSVIEVTPGDSYFINTKGPHNRFIVSLSMSLNAGSKGVHLKIELNSSGDEEFNFINTGGYKYLFVTVSNKSQEPKVFIYNRIGLNISGKEVFTQDSEKAIKTNNLEDSIIIESKIEDSTYERINTLPKTSAKLRLWLKSDNLLLNNGDPVANWRDMSGNNESVVQTNESKQPEFVKEAYNGLPAVRFKSNEGSLMTLASLRPLFKNQSAVTIIVVAKTNILGDSGRILYVSGSASTAITRLRFGEHNKMYDTGARTPDSEQFVHPARVQEGVNIDLVKPRIQKAEVNWMNGSISLSINGENVAQNSSLIKGRTDDTTPLAFYLGGSNIDGQYFDGDICEVLIYEGILPNRESQEIDNYLSEKWGITTNCNSKQNLTLTTKYNTKNSLTEFDTSTLMLIGIKQINGNFNKHPETVGYLWTDNTERNVYYSSRINETPSFLFQFQETNTLTYYKPIICRNGDVIFVRRGELFSNSPRSNPVIYKRPNYERQEVVLESKQPTSWLQNCGMDYVYDDETDYIIFSEYVRPHHSVGRVWKVTSPFEKPENWKVTMELTAGDESTEIEHFHTANFDPYSGNWLVTSGDEDMQCRNWVSTDKGETWIEVAGGEQKYRVLNYVFTKEYIYWAVDYLDHNHALYRVRRSGGIPDFNQTELLANLPRGQSTYGLAYLPSKNGILILDRAEQRTDLNLDIMYWSIKDESVHRIDRLKALPSSNGFFGFRCSAITLYANKEDDVIVCGFDSNVANSLDVLGNENGSIKTLILKY